MAVSQGTKNTLAPVTTTTQATARSSHPVAGPAKPALPATGLQIPRR